MAKLIVWHTRLLPYSPIVPGMGLFAIFEWEEGWIGLPSEPTVPYLCGVEWDSGGKGVV